MENIICTTIKLMWIPPALLSLIVVAVLFLKRQREPDYLEKDNIERKIKYPIIAFILCILFTPVLDFFVSGALFPIDCKNDELFTNPGSHTLREFSDGTTQKNISFIESGSFNSDVSIKIPWGAKVTSAKIGLEHPTENMWEDEFYDHSKSESDGGIGIEPKEHYAYIMMRKLEVNETVTLEGKQIYDDVYVGKTGSIIVGWSKKLNLVVRGTLTIESGGKISASGQPDVKAEDYEYVLATREPTIDASGGGGGGYGGDGGKGGDNGKKQGGRGGTTYGKDTNPIERGMNGAKGGGAEDTDPRGAPGTGGSGGGVIIIDANKLILNGKIESDGADGGYGTPSKGTAGGGGGSGGSVYLTTKNLLHNGLITADGGNGGDDLGSPENSDGGGGGAGGGRIYVVYEKKTGYGDASVKGGAGGKSSDQSKNGIAGTKGTINWQYKEISEMSLIKANLSSVEINPDNRKTWQVFYANATNPAGSDTQYAIINSLTGEVLCDLKNVNPVNGYNITECIGRAEGIKLQAYLSTISFQRTPKLYNWKVSYESEIKGLKMDIGIDQIEEYENPSFGGGINLTDKNANYKLTEQLNKLIKECNCRGCTPTNEYCIISIRFESKTSGSLYVKNPEIGYNL